MWFARPHRAVASPSPTQAWPCCPAGTGPPWGWQGKGGASLRWTKGVLHTGATSPAGGAASCCGTWSTPVPSTAAWPPSPGRARHMGWETVQLDPPIRASRYFRYFGGMRSIHPDAFGLLRRGSVAWPFFLEWERRAVRPSTMSECLAPYLRYFSSHRPTDDHGVQPSALVVFEDKLVRTHFLRLAREEMQAARVQVSLWVSHSKAIDVLGPLGGAWRAPGDWDSHQALPPP